MKDKTNKRKIEHIKIACDKAMSDRCKKYFDDILLTHRALPEINFDDISTSVNFMGKKLSFPLLISSLTGGDNELIIDINRRLAKAAEETRVAMAVGSQRVMFSNLRAKKSFQIRKYAPSTLLFSNIGAVQLNKGFTIKECREAMETVNADALCLHVNPLQEAIQPEGDTCFAGLSEKIGKIVAELNHPVIIKEVGAGISIQDIDILLKQNVRYIDIAGSGGTSWSLIEHYRSDENIGLIFQDWGVPTPIALQQLAPYRNNIKMIASGGIRTGIDMIKAIILGASLCAQGLPFLRPAMESTDAVIQHIEELKKSYKIGMFLLGVRNFKELHGNKNLILRE